MNKPLCVFCQLPLDGSDEHIIPQSLNGRLHSKEIICHNCNSNIFGQKVDPIAKQLFNPLMLILGWDNANGVKAEDNKGDEYSINKKLEALPIRPSQELVKKGSARILNVEGDPKNAIKMFGKEAKKIIAEGKVLKDLKVTEFSGDSTLKTKWEIKGSDELNLLLNKIAIEFYSYHKFDSTSILSLSRKIISLENNIGNVKLCNQQNEVRDFDENEVSHLIVLKGNKQSGKLYCYIELFNLICAVVTLTDEYEGDDIDNFYHQDAISGERFTNPVNLKMSLPEILAYNFDENDFHYQTNYLFERIRSRELSKVLATELPKIYEDVKARVEKGEVDKSNLEATYIDESAKLLAQLTVFDFPYILTDQPDEENDDYNWIHSNFRESIVDQTIHEYSDLIGKRIQIGKDIFVITDFLKQPRIVKINKKLVTLFVVLRSEGTSATRYLKIKDLIDGLIAGGN